MPNCQLSMYGNFRFAVYMPFLLRLLVSLGLGWFVPLRFGLLVQVGLGWLVPGRVGRRVFGGVVAEADADRLVVAALFLVHQLGEHLQVGLGRLAPEGERPRVEVAGQHRVQLGRVQAELGQDQQERHDPDDGAERAVRVRRVLQLVGEQAGADGDQRGEDDGAEDRAGQEAARTYYLGRQQREGGEIERGVDKQEPDDDRDSDRVVAGPAGQIAGA